MPKKKIRVIDYGLDEAGLLGVTAISLVDYPAIESDFVCLSKDGHTIVRHEKVKMAAVDTGERRMIYGPAMIPDVLILRGTGEEEFYVRFGKDLIQAVAHDYLKKHLQNNVNVQHQFSIKGVTVVESWVKEFDNDKSVGLGLDVPVGTWLIGMHAENDEAWELAKEGMVKGFSIEGDFKPVAETFIETEVNDDNKFLIELEKTLLAHANS